MRRTPRRPVNPPEGAPAEWCDHCERDVIEGAPSDHDEGCPRYRDPPKPDCSVCNPRPMEHRHLGPTGLGPVFCDDHDREDLAAMTRAEVPNTRPPMEER